ncbi:MAG: cytochrome c peroxidase [Ferruginibacter sp.]
MRSVTLEDQAEEVMKNSTEFNFSSGGIAKMLLRDSSYVNLLIKAFGVRKDTLSGFEVRNSLAAFVRSLTPFSSSFDEYMKGNMKALSAEQITGFNLFSGKAKCATCHFIPIFNGTIPPWLVRSESEIIGVPASPLWKIAVIDTDSGRYRINPMAELMYSFKTPTLRNIEKTGPYMHNGVYKTLEEVVEFYSKGGGVGLGIELPFQSLPFDSLSLYAKEKKAIVSFMISLTDKDIRY